MKPKGSTVLIFVVAMLLFAGLDALNTAYGASFELVDIRIIVEDTGLQEDKELDRDAEGLLSGTTTMLQEQKQTFTEFAYEHENNGQSNHFEYTHQLIPEPSTLLLLSLGGLCLFGRARRQ